MRTAKRWKVVETDGGVLRSAHIRALRVEYPPGQWVEAPVGGLLVFSRLADAISFAKALRFPDSWRTVQVWEAECSGRVKLPPYRCSSDNARACAAVWEYRYAELWKDGFVCVKWPDRTQAFRRVRLVRQLKGWWKMEA